MRGSMWRQMLMAAALCGWLAAAHAGDGRAMQCDAPQTQGSMLFPDRLETISALQQMPESCLKILVTACSNTAHQQMLDPGSAAMCSMGYEALLRKTFNGSFHAMLAWWQSERATAPGP